MHCAFAMELSMGQRKAVTEKPAATCCRGSQAHKAPLLDERCEPTASHREETIKTLPAAGRVRRDRGCSFACLATAWPWWRRWPCANG
jgi:hypothetical protein